MFILFFLVFTVRSAAPPTPYPPILLITIVMDWENMPYLKSEWIFFSYTPKVAFYTEYLLLDIGPAYMTIEFRSFFLMLSGFEKHPTHLPP